MYVMEAVTTAGLVQRLRLKTRCGDKLPDPPSTQNLQEVHWPTQISQVNATLLPTAWRVAWFFILIVYLYPDLAVYSVFISDTVQVVFPVIDYYPHLFISGDGVYYSALVLSSIFLTPWVFGSFKGTTALQVVTTITRNVLLWSMIIIAICMLTGRDVGQLSQTVDSLVPSNSTLFNSSGVALGVHSPFQNTDLLAQHRQAVAWLPESAAVAAPANAPQKEGKQAAHTPATSGHGHREDLPWADFSKVPLLFGGIVYSTIHQQYAPSILSPLKNKPRNLLRTHRSVLCGVTAYYLALCLTAVAAFARYNGVGDAAVAAAGGEETQCNALTPHPCQLQALYTFNFGFVRPAWFARFIAMAPLLSMLSNFPLIAMTLRDNLMILTAICLQHAAGGEASNNSSSREHRGASRRGYLRVAATEPRAVATHARGSGDTTAPPADASQPQDRSRQLQLYPGQAESDGDARSAKGYDTDTSTAAEGERQPLRRNGSLSSLPNGSMAGFDTSLVHPLEGQGVASSMRRNSSVDSSLGGASKLRLGSAAHHRQASPASTPPLRDAAHSSAQPSGHTWQEWAHTMARDLATPSEASFEARVCFALLSVMPAYLSAALTRDIDFLLRIVGCFGGAFIAFVMPCVLLAYAREAQQLPFDAAASVHQVPGTGSAQDACSQQQVHVPTPQLEHARRLLTHSQLFRAPAGGPRWRAAILTFAGVAFLVNSYSVFIAG